MFCRLLLIGLFMSMASLKLTMAAVGADLSAATGEASSESDFHCLKRSGYDFMVIQAWDGGYGWNTKIAANVKDAWKAGMSHVDVYVFMCPQCGSSASSVITTVVDGLKEQKVNYGMLWIDVEQCKDCWGSLGTNAEFVAEGVNTAISKGAKVGIYSSEYEWSITIGGFTGFSHLPQWYADWDGAESFSDHGYNFGGFKNPAMKQLADQGACTNVDVDYYPNSWKSTYTKLIEGKEHQSKIDVAALRKFYGLAHAVSEAAASSSSSSSSDSSQTVWIVCVVLAVVLIATLLLVAGVLLYRRHRLQRCTECVPPLVSAADPTPAEPAPYSLTESA